MRTIALKNVTATDLVRSSLRFTRKWRQIAQGFTSEIAANDRSNSLIILSSEANFRAMEKLVLSFDTEDAQEKVVQTFMLKNADAQDVAKQLQDLRPDQDTPRYPYYFFSSSGQDNKPQETERRGGSTAQCRDRPGAARPRCPEA